MMQEHLTDLQDDKNIIKSPPFKYILYQNVSCNFVYRWIPMEKMKYSLWSSQTRA